jgi:hypothetical protein
MATDKKVVKAKGLVAGSFTKNIVAKYIGQKVAILAARYQYRGILAEVGDDYVVLSPATAVEQSGANGNTTPAQEDPVNGMVCIKTDAIEIFYQPTWSQAPLQGE